MAKFIIKGKSTQDILELPLDTLESLSRGELAKVTSRLTSTANKRLKRFEKQGIDFYKREKYSVKGKDTKQLLETFKDVKTFLGRKTSTLKEYKKWRKTVKSYMGDVDEDTFWDIYSKLDNEDAIYSNFKYQTWDTIRTEVEKDNKDLSPKEREKQLDRVRQETLKKIIDTETLNNNKETLEIDEVDDNFTISSLDDEEQSEYYSPYGKH